MKNLTPAEHLVRNFYLEKKSLMECIFVEKEEKTQTRTLYDQLELNESQKEIFKEFVSTLLDDTLYSILLGLDGSATIGISQETYTIFDEQGNRVSECGDLETEAYAYFFENKIENE